IYFLSDRGPHLNLYRYDTRDDKTTQLTNYASDDARWASGDQAGQIVYEVTGALHIYDTRNNTDRALEIHVPSDLVATRAAERSVQKYIEDFALSNNGKRAAFTARGDIFSVPLEHGISVDLTHTPGVHEREVSWSRDGKRVVGAAAGADDKVIAQDPGNLPGDYTWSPGGHYRAYSLTDKDTQQPRLYVY